MAYDAVPDFLDAIDRYIDAKLLELTDSAEMRDTRAKASKIRRDNLERAFRGVLQYHARASTLPSSASSMRLEAIKPDKEGDDK
jgi:hypothetical protein